MERGAPENRNLSMDLLRGTCAAGIAVYHYLAWGHGITFRSLGTFGVYTFFVISAVAMMMTYSDRFSREIDLAALKDFYWKRIIRIMPLLMFVTIFAYFYFQKSGIRSISTGLLSGSGLFALHMPGMHGLSAGVWSLGIELFFYALFPIICLLSSNCQLRTLIAAFLILITAQQALLITLPPPSDPMFWRQYTMPLTFAPFFAAGLIIYRFRLPVSGLNAAIAAIFVVAIFVFSAIWPVEIFEGGISYLLLTGFALGAVSFAYRSILPRFLHVIAWFVGEISYSLYLTHWYAYHLVSEFDPAIRWALYSITAVGIATAVTFLFERPVKIYLRSRRGGRAAFPAPSPAE